MQLNCSPECVLCFSPQHKKAISIIAKICQCDSTKFLGLIWRQSITEFFISQGLEVGGFIRISFRANTKRVLRYSLWLERYRPFSRCAAMAVIPQTRSLKTYQMPLVAALPLSQNCVVFFRFYCVEALAKYCLQCLQIEGRSTTKKETI